MLKRILIILILLSSLSGVVASQEEDDIPDDEETTVVEAQDFVAVVEVESAFVRLFPDFEAEPVASIFELDVLEAVGRNLDGTWFEVRRPGRMTNLGWVFGEMIDWDFRPEFLPLRDISTGVLGAMPLAEDTGFAAFIVEGVALRNNPFLLGSTRITNIPPNVTIPVLERNQDGSWLHVNYLGYDGWIIGFTARDIPNLLDIPLAPNLPPLQTPEVIIIPPEIQLAQVERLRVYLNERLDLARGFESFWWGVFRGEVMPCDAPPPIPVYVVTDQDVRELPELDRYLPQITRGVSLLNSTISPLNDCGIVTPDEVRDARDDAINARIIFEANLERLDNLEENVIQ